MKVKIISGLFGAIIGFLLCLVMTFYAVKVRDSVIIGNYLSSIDLVKYKESKNLLHQYAYKFNVVESLKGKKICLITEYDEWTYLSFIGFILYPLIDNYQEWKPKLLEVEQERLRELEKQLQENAFAPPPALSHAPLQGMPPASQ